ncbi:MAG TPA: hypothetical protein VLG28_06630 [Acidimicrobiia bacterium]|jgi:hypothetical protein|nr:hypothetical protein [Acidimicrobiia bacterium]
MNDVDHGLPPRHILYALVGAGLLGVMGVFVFASGLVVPFWATAVLVLVWLVAVVMSVRSWKARMFGPVMWGVVVALFWVAFVAGGEAIFGWSA